MGVVTGGTGHFPIRIQGQDDAEFLFHDLHMCQRLGRGLDQMIVVSGVAAFNHVAALTEYFQIPDELHIFVAVPLLIRLYHMTVETDRGLQLALGIELIMGIEL